MSAAMDRAVRAVSALGRWQGRHAKDLDALCEAYRLNVLAGVPEDIAHRLYHARLRVLERDLPKIANPRGSKRCWLCDGDEQPKLRAAT